VTRRLLLAAVLLALTAPAASAASLAGTEWQFKTVRGERVSAGSPFDLAFKNDGTVSGRHTCDNSFGGDYRARGSRLRFGKLHTTLIGCEGPGARPDVLGALAKTRAYRRAGRRLVLLDGRGRRLARLRRR
jgi:heat shock protein HslJ